ncbi:MAG: Cof-type HAD-IIB family hydrolase [Clostridiales bacterium]|nr:Cof-type HAD-IIB family hydrolase [Clostridiales bacterium]
MIKLVVSDIDGTLIHAGGALSGRTKEAVKRLKDKGVVFAMASGRTFYNAITPALEIGIDCPVISAGGGRLDMHTYPSCVYENTMDEALAAEVMEKLIASGCFMTSYTGLKVYRLSERNGLNSACVSVSEAKEGRSYAIIDEFEQMRRYGTRGVYKFEAYSDDRKLLSALRGEFDRMGLPSDSAFPYSLEIMPRASSKGAALKALKAELSLKTEEVMAIGDGENDMSMLMEAGLKIAMANGAEKTKALADEVAPDASDDGAARAIERFVLGETL